MLSMAEAPGIGFTLLVATRPVGDVQALTNERELTEPVDLCLPDGRHLNPAAVGWSRRPLHNANLSGWGRTKRWDYWAVLTPTHAFSVTYADVDYLGIADVWWANLETGESGGCAVTRPLGRGLDLPEVPGSVPLVLREGELLLELVTEGDHRQPCTIRCEWIEYNPDFVPMSLDLTIDAEPGHESLNVVIPWTDKRFQYTSKHQARAARGTFTRGDTVIEFGSPSGQRTDDDAWGVLDVGRGRWPYRTRWNWGGGAGHADDGTVVGIQLGGKWTEGTQFTENGLICDGVLYKIGRELVWDYSWSDPMRPWRVTDPGGAFEATLTPRFDRHSRTEALVLGTEVHQVFGHWSGWCDVGDGGRRTFSELLGFAEESRSRW